MEKDGKVRIIDATITPSTGTPYVDGDFIGVDNTPITFDGAAANIGQGGAVIGAQLINGVAEAVAGELWLFDTAPTGLGLDAAAFTVTDADAARLICVIPFLAADYQLSALNGVCGGIPKGAAAYKCITGATAIYGAFVAGGVFTSPALTIRLTVLQNSH
jgi:hypothetical protein